jgi:membrane protein DedA with SNARE-associated domain/membrane-associated phospholipid phosphatase
LALGAVALVAFAESLAIVGSLVPAAVFMFAAGALVAHGSIGLWPTLLLATAGAVMGDAVSYELGATQKDRVSGWRSFQRHAGAVRKAEAFMQRRGAISIMLARFTGAVRAFVPLLAGFSHMPRGTFYATNIASAMLWAPAHILPGVLFGSSLKVAEAASGRLAVLLVLVAILLWAAVWLVTRVRAWLARTGAGLRDRILLWARASHALSARAAVALLDPDVPGSQSLALGLALLLASMWVFFWVLEDVIAKEPLVTADSAAFRSLQQMRTEPADAVMIVITEMGSVGVMLPLILAVAGWLLWRRCRRTAGYWVFAVVGAELLVQVLKPTLGRARPLELYQGIEQFAFPSGHATISTVVLGFLAFLLTRQGSGAWRWSVAALGAAYVVLVAFSRLYLGAHWFSDVLGGISFGLAWVALLATVYTHRRIEEPVEPHRLALVALAVIAVASTAWTQWRGPDDAKKYAVSDSPEFVSGANWIAGGWRSIPTRRQDFAGEWEEDFTLQWACQRQQLTRRLLATGWQLAPGLSFASLLRVIAPGAVLEDFPVLPRYDLGQASAIVFARNSAADTPQRREVLRLWRSRVLVETPDGGKLPLWYGATYVQERAASWNWPAENASDPAQLLENLGRNAATWLWRPAPAVGVRQPAPVLLSCARLDPAAPSDNTTATRLR